MAKGNKIVISSDPRGRFIEGFLSHTDSTTPKPGTCMEIDTGVEPVGGRFTWEPFGVTAASSNQGVAADGDQRLIAVLLPDTLQGVAADTAYSAATSGPSGNGSVRIFMYIPLPGDELNMIVEDVGGTGDDIAIGNILEVDDGTGKLILSTSGESEPFIALETITNPTADTLLWTMFTGY